MIRFAWYETKNESITNWAISSIADDDLLTAYNQLRKIRGVGNKISSFYLRDIYLLSDSKSKNIDNRYLLQPIDVWTRRAARTFLNDQDASDKKCAEFLINKEDELGVSNGSLNVALWVLGSQVVKNDKTFTENIQELKKENHRKLINSFTYKIENTRTWLSLLEGIRDSL